MKKECKRRSKESAKPSKLQFLNFLYKSIHQNLGSPNDGNGYKYKHIKCCKGHPPFALFDLYEMKPGKEA